VRACQKRACGATEAEASVCYDRKAITCSLFVPNFTPEEARGRFRSLSEKDLARHWPSVGKLAQILKQAGH